MNSNPHNPLPSESVPPDPVSRSAEETLRLIASLPAPAGLEDRVHAALRAAPHGGRVAGERRGRVLAWPKALRPESSWMRTAAAAAIVFVVAGGGWGVYTRVEKNQPAKVIVTPHRIPVPGGFSGAGALRTPQTLPGPAVTQPAKASPSRTKAAKKPAASSAPAAKGQRGPAAAPGAQPPASR